jgi:hypothetical protein
MPISGMPLVEPTRLMFEQGELDRVVYHMHDGRVVEYKRIDNPEEE